MPPDYEKIAWMTVIQFALKLEIAHRLSLFTPENAQNYKSGFLRSFDQIPLPEQIIFYSEQQEAQALQRLKEVAKQFIQEIEESEAVFRKSNGTGYQHPEQ